MNQIPWKISSDFQHRDHGSRLYGLDAVSTAAGAEGRTIQCWSRFFVSKHAIFLGLNWGWHGYKSYIWMSTHVNHVINVVMNAILSYHPCFGGLFWPFLSYRLASWTRIKCSCPCCRSWLRPKISVGSSKVPGNSQLSLRIRQMNGWLWTNWLYHLDLVSYWDILGLYSWDKGPPVIHPSCLVLFSPAIVGPNPDEGGAFSAHRLQCPGAGAPISV